MHPSEYDNVAQLGRNHWWFVSKRRLVRQLIADYLPLNLQGMYSLDIGCGPGDNLREYREINPVTFGLDYSPYALNYARKEHPQILTQGNMLTLPYPEKTFALIMVLDVFYHQWVTDDMAALNEIYRVLQIGGLLILTAPAFSFLSGPHDTVNFSARRYTLPQMREMLQAVGFFVVKGRYFYASTFPLVLVKRLWQRLFTPNHPPTSDVKPVWPAFNWLLQKILLIEMRLFNRIALPWGGTVVLVAIKKQGKSIHQ